MRKLLVLIVVCVSALGMFSCGGSSDGCPGIVCNDCGGSGNCDVDCQAPDVEFCGHFRKKLATFVLIISFIGILAQMSYNFFISKSMEVYGPGEMIMPVMVIVVGVFLVWYSKKMHTQGILS